MTEWTNTHIGHKKIGQINSIGMPCNICSGGILMQQYNNIIYCAQCATKWRAFKMRGFSKRQQFKQELANTYI